LCIINDRADVAAAVDADGAHVGQEDLSVKDCRAIVGPRILIGVSTHHIEQARAAVLDGANYLGAGPTFESSTKTFGDFAGLDYLREVASEIGLPTFAIGGIAMHNLSDVLATGISRVAVGAAVTAAADPACAARELLGMLKGAITSQAVPSL
jgi:thiamine-phosphate pyrophosphorylase